MRAILDVVFPVFAVILAGVVAGRFRILGQDSSEALNRYVYWFALPALFFLAMNRASLRAGPVLPFALAYLGAVTIVWSLVMAIGRYAFSERLGAAGLGGFVATFANTGYMGIPLFITAFGDKGTLPAIIASVLNGAVVTGVAIAIVEVDRGAARGFGRAACDALAAVARNPLVIAPFAGLMLGQAGMMLPTPIANFADLIGASAGPCALFAIGLFLASRPLAALVGGRKSIEVGWLTLAKLVLHPLVAWWLAAVSGLDAFWTASLTILSALPTGALAFVIAQQHGVFVERASAVILVSTVVSGVTLSALWIAFDPFPP
jgi:predicted permease